jgi:two-component system response regulator PhoP
MQFKVAVLEDDEILREQILVPDLNRLGFDVEGFATSAALYRRMVGNTFQLLVMDIGLRDDDGFAVARHLRSTLPIGIVSLTARAGRDDRLRGLDEGIDAWLLKPVDIDVLAATLKSLGRRLRESSNDPTPLLPVGWRIPEGSWSLHAPNGESVLLNLQERRVLLRLLATPGQPATREQLIGDLAGLGADFDPHRLEMLVHRLRRKVAERLGEELPLRTVRGCGYVMLSGDERSKRP